MALDLLIIEWSPPALVLVAFSTLIYYSTRRSYPSFVLSTGTGERAFLADGASLPVEALWVFMVAGRHLRRR